MSVLVIVNPGCDTKCQEDLKDAARVLLLEYSQVHDPKGLEQGVRENHHACGEHGFRHEFESIRGAHYEYDREAYFDSDPPTIHPIRHPAGAPSGATCLGCDGTGRIPFACAANTCPLCGGDGVQVDEDLDPGVFPLGLIHPEFVAWAIVTPDGRWHDDVRGLGRSWGSDWRRKVVSYYRHCFGVYMNVDR